MIVQNHDYIHIFMPNAKVLKILDTWQLHHG